MDCLAETLEKFRIVFGSEALVDVLHASRTK